MHAATYLAGSRGDPATHTSPENPRSGPTAHHSQSPGLHVEDGLSAPDPRDRHTKTAIPSVHPCHAFHSPRPNPPPSESSNTKICERFFNSLLALWHHPANSDAAANPLT